jgi:hypothetical protein
MKGSTKIEDTDSWGDIETEILKTCDALHDGHIRLLRLIPGENNEDIARYLIAISLDTKPRYEAISYAWAKSSNTVRMTLNGKTC